jgi:hypothetical protein
LTHAASFRGGGSLDPGHSSAARAEDLTASVSGVGLTVFKDSDVPAPLVVYSLRHIFRLTFPEYTHI